LGVELARAQIAYQLGKRYVQDEELGWGVTNSLQNKNDRKSHRENSFKEKKHKK
jgi:hypothetical protein